MAVVSYENLRVEAGAGRSVLDALLEAGVPAPHACRSGVCQSCLMQAVEGRPPAEAQQGLKETQRVQGYFLACICHPRDDLKVTLPESAGRSLVATVSRLRRLNADILEVALATEGPLDYRAGQFITVMKESGEGRSYSLASVPGEDEVLRLHVRRLPGGRVSGWIHDEWRVGQSVAIRGPGGDCLYAPGQPEQPLLLIGTGSGLAPLYGIVRDALRQGHTGPIRLFHGSRDRHGLYLVDALRELVRSYPQFDYVPCLSGPDRTPGHAPGRVHDVALTEIPDLKGWRVFLCGHPEMVQQAQMRAYLAGASLAEIHADAFTVQAAQPKETATA